MDCVNILDLDLIKDKKLRDKSISRIDVLDKVKDIILIGETNFATTKQVAEYYETGEEAIKSIVTRSNDEVSEDGYRNYSKSEVVELLKIHTEHLVSTQAKSIATLNSGETFDIPNRGLRLFPKRAILRVGMLLVDSEVAKEVRSQLLNIVHDTKEDAPHIVDNIICEIDKEKSIMLRKVQAMFDGNIEESERCNVELFELKNKRIMKLESEKQLIQENSLTIEGARKIINKITQTMAVECFNNQFGVTYNKLYSFVNTKLGINVKSRMTKRDTKSMIETLSDDELFDVERIARTWADNHGVNVGELISLMESDM